MTADVPVPAERHSGPVVPVLARLVERFAPSNRSLGIDVARGVALLGMIITHVVPLMSTGDQPTFAAVFSGRASALFAVLAGVSIVLSTSRTLAQPGARPWAAAAVGLVVRGVIIAVLGLFLGSLGTPVAVILVNYGVMFVLSTLFLRMPGWTLGALSAVWLVGTPVLSFLLRRDLQLLTTYEVPSLGTASDVSWLFTELFITGYYPILQWMGYLLLGMFAARLRVRSVRGGLSLAACGAGLSVLAVSISSLLLSAGGRTALEIATAHDPSVLDHALHTTSYGVTPTDTWWWLAISGPHSATPFDLLATSGIAAAVIGLCIVLCETLRDRFGQSALLALAPLSAPGSMPLSVYFGHVLLLGFTDSSFGGTGPTGDWTEFTLHAVVFIAASILWKLGISARGPLEWVVNGAARAASRSVLRT